MKKTTKHLPLVIGVSFTLVVYALLLIFEKELLFRSQELSLWLPTEMWFSQRMAYPAGFMTVCAAFLGQFMYYPWLGTLLLVGLWLLTYGLTLKVFRIPANRSAVALIPVGLLVGCALEVGYWLFLIKTHAYLFSAAVGYTFMLLAVFGWQQMRVAWHRWVYVAVLTVAGFPLFGFYALMAALLIALMAAKGEQDNQPASRRDWVTVAVGIVGIALIPYLYYYAFTMERQGWIYLSGLPKFHYKKELIGYWMPYILLFLSAIVMTLCRFKAPKNDEAAVSQPANSKSRIAINMIERP